MATTPDDPPPNAREAMDALTRVTKWAILLTGWQLGTRASDDPECRAVRDHREATLMLRVEMSALVALLVEHGVLTWADWYSAVEREAAMLNIDMAERFPGVTATLDGLQIDPQRVIAAGWMQGWKP